MVPAATAAKLYHDSTGSDSPDRDRSNAKVATPTRTPIAVQSGQRGIREEDGTMN